jgi:hypothetical protein
MGILKRLKKYKTDICTVIGMLAFFSLSGAVPENPNGLQQGFIALLIILICVFIGKREVMP